MESAAGSESDPEIHERAESWSAERLQRLLEELEIDGVASMDAREMAILALQDLDVGNASDAALRVVFSGALRAGVRQNLVSELRADRPWEEFADLFAQAGIFDACVLMQEAFPREFGKPDAVAVRTRVSSGSATARAWLNHRPPALLLRILAAGFSERSVLHRFFEESIASDSFPEAASILWTVECSEGTDSSHEFLLISSHQWFDLLEDVECFHAKARPDTNEAD